MSSDDLDGTGHQRRSEFLLAMYSEAWKNIERHILVVWQSAGVVAATLAIFTLVEKNVLPIDIAATFEILILGWMYAHVLDAEYWFKRNIHIIGNIENQFLLMSDLQEIHPYFGRSEKPPALDHLWIQKVLAITLAALLLVIHAYMSLQEGFACLSVLPYVALALTILWLVQFGRSQNLKFKELVRSAPGKQISTNLAP